MSERLTWEEIKQRYPDEWVLLVELDEDEYVNVRSARVAAHSAERKEIDRAAAECVGAPIGILYAGEPSELPVALIL
jgi:hypothetical protein